MTKAKANLKIPQGRAAVIRFLRKEAHNIYLSLSYQVRRQTTEQEIYRRLKRQWKTGDRLSREARNQAGKAMNYKQIIGQPIA